MMRSLAPIGFIVAMLFPWSASAQPSPAKKLERAIDKAVRAAGIKPDEPGAAILIWQPGRRPFQKGYGLATLDDGTAILPSTMFELASLTKPFTAIAILELMERGKLTLDDDIRKHLPEVDIKDARRTITIRHLLHHTSALPEYLQFEHPDLGDKGYWINNDFLAVFKRQGPETALRAPVGRKHEYCNTNYMLLASIVARVSGQSFGEFLRANVLKPAGMNDSFVLETPAAAPQLADAKRRAIGYTKDDNGTWQPSWGAPPARSEQMLTVGDGGLWSNLADLKNFDQALRDNRLISAETLKLSLESSKTFNGQVNNYGLGWSIYPTEPGAPEKGLNGFGHNGSWAGFETSYYRFQLADRTTVILTNRGGFDVDGFWYKLNDAAEAAFAE